MVTVLKSPAHLLESILLVFKKTPLNSFQDDRGDILHREYKDGYTLHRPPTKTDHVCKYRRSGIRCHSLKGFKKARLHGRNILIQGTCHLLMISSTASSPNSSYSYAHILDR